MTRFRHWLMRLTGGRPMTRQGFAFVDRVSGARVYYYTDALGRPWMAAGPWSRFRVRPVTERALARALARAFDAAHKEDG